MSSIPSKRSIYTKKDGIRALVSRKNVPHCILPYIYLCILSMFVHPFKSKVCICVSVEQCKHARFEALLYIYVDKTAQVNRSMFFHLGNLRMVHIHTAVPNQLLKARKNHCKKPSGPLGPSAAVNLYLPDGAPWAQHRVTHKRTLRRQTYSLLSAGVTLPELV